MDALKLVFYLPLYLCYAIAPFVIAAIPFVLALLIVGALMH